MNVSRRGGQTPRGKKPKNERNLIEGTASDDDDILWENFRVQTFDEAGVMTRDAGLVITLPDGTEFQLTIVQSR